MQKEVSPSGTLVGTLLGDACIPLQNGKPRPQGGPKDLCFASNSDKLLQAPTRSIIYMTFLKTRSGDFVGTPPRVNIFRGGGAQDRKQIRF